MSRNVRGWALSCALISLAWISKHPPGTVWLDLFREIALPVPLSLALLAFAGVYTAGSMVTPKGKDE